MSWIHIVDQHLSKIISDLVGYMKYLYFIFVTNKDFFLIYIKVYFIYQKNKITSQINSTGLQLCFFVLCFYILVIWNR